MLKTMLIRYILGKIMGMTFIYEKFCAFPGLNQLPLCWNCISLFSNNVTIHA